MEKKVISLELETTGFDQVEQQTKSLKAQLREAQSEVAQLSEKFGATSAEAVKAAKRASELKDAIADAKDLTDSFNPDAKFNSLTRSIGGAMDGFSAFQGTLGLIGVESQDVEKMILKVQSAMALSQGLQGLMEAKDSFKQLGAVISDTFKGIKGALLASGIGAFVVLLGTVVSYWDEIKEAVGGAKTEQDLYNQTQEEYTAGAKEAIQTTQKVGTAFEMAKKGVISKEEALTTYNETLGDTFGKATTLAQAEELYNKKADAYVEAMAQRARANALFELSAQKNAEKLALATKDQTTIFDKAVAGFDYMLGNHEKATKKIIESQVKRTKENEKSLNKEIDLLDSSAKKALLSAETKEKANGIQSESEIKLSNKKQELAKQNADKEAQYKKEAIDNIKALEAEYSLYQKTEQEKEIFAVQEKYKKALEDSKKYGKDNSQLLLAQKNELNDIDAKYLDLQAQKFNETQQLILEAKKQSQQNQIDLDNEFNQKIEDLSELNRQATQTQYQNEIDAVNEKYFALEQSAQGNADAEREIAEAKARDLKAIDKSVQDAKVQMASDALGSLQGLVDSFGAKSEAQAKKQFQVSKALSLAQAIITTYQAVNQQLANPTDSLYGANFVKAGIALTTGLANVIKISQTKFNGGAPSGGGSISSSNNATQTVTSSAPSFQIVGNAGANPLANLGGNPIKAYVVSQEVTTSQELDRNHIKNATFQ